MCPDHLTLLSVVLRKETCGYFYSLQGVQGNYGKYVKGAGDGVQYRKFLWSF